MLMRTYCYGNLSATGIGTHLRPCSATTMKAFAAMAANLSTIQGSWKTPSRNFFVELWQSKSRIPVTSVRAYLLKSLKYKILKSHRQRRRLLPIGDGHSAFEWSHEDRLIAGERDAEKSRKVLNALDRLSNRQKEIVYLKYFQNLSYEEISDVMNINYQVARTCFTRRSSP